MTSCQSSKPSNGFPLSLELNPKIDPPKQERQQGVLSLQEGRKEGKKIGRKEGGRKIFKTLRIKKISSSFFFLNTYR